MTKRALVMSGGGVKGAFQVGVLSELTCSRKDWGYISGVSVGALNAAMLGQAQPGQMFMQFSALQGLWLDGIKGNSSVWKHWFPFRRLSGLWKSSFYNSAPLQQLISRYVSPAALRRGGRELRFGAVAYGSGEYREATQSTPDICKWVAASAAFPPMLVPPEIVGDVWMDGGVRCITPLQGAIDWGAEEIDVILASPRKTQPASTKKLSAIDVALRAIELQGDELFVRDIKTCTQYNSLVAAGAAPGKRAVKLNVYEPKEPLLSGEFSSLEFDPAKIREMIEAGKKVARNA
jgi:NTE family protein